MTLLEISFADKRWRTIRGLTVRLEKAAKITLASLPKNLQFSCTMTLLLANDAAIKQLNRDFRGKDKPTNVLSFPQWEASELTKMGKRHAPIAVGDIAIGYQYVVVESEKEHKILINHVTHLFIHGLLHLFGYDHPSDTEAVLMERLEKRIMAKLGLPDPYQQERVAHGKKRSPKTHKHRT